MAYDDRQDVLDVLKQAAEDAAKALEQRELKGITELVRRQIELEDLKALLEGLSKTCQKQLDIVQDQRLPEAMLDAETRAYETDTGLKVKITPMYFGSVSKENMAEFCDWLHKEDRDGIITTNIKRDLGKGQREDALEVLEALKEAGIEGFVLDESVHWQSLRALARELMEQQAAADAGEEGAERPDVFRELKIHKIDRAKITRPKG